MTNKAKPIDAEMIAIEARSITEQKPETTYGGYGKKVNTLFAAEFVRMLRDELLHQAMQETKRAAFATYEKINTATVLTSILELGTSDDSDKLVTCSYVIEAVNQLTACGFHWASSELIYFRKKKK